MVFRVWHKAMVIYFTLLSSVYQQSAIRSVRFRSLASGLGYPFTRSLVGLDLRAYLSTDLSSDLSIDLHRFDLVSGLVLSELSRLSLIFIDLLTDLISFIISSIWTLTSKNLGLYLFRFPCLGSGPGDINIYFLLIWNLIIGSTLFHPQRSASSYFHQRSLYFLLSP